MLLHNNTALRHSVVYNPVVVWIGFVRGLKAQGLTGIFISHNMQHVFQSCDRIVAMARGEIVFDKPTVDTSIEEVHELL